MRFRCSVWKNIRQNWSEVFESWSENFESSSESLCQNYGKAYLRVLYYVRLWGGDECKFKRVWPDMGSPHPVATRCGDVVVAVQYLDEES